MARLIDADALQQHFTDMQNYDRCACNFMDDGGEPATEWYCVEDALENAPTVDAVPVEWIRNMMLEREAEESRAAWLVMREWKREVEVGKVES